MNRLLIRADSNAQIGNGHLMRCLALAEHWQGNGGQVTFLGHCESAELRQRLEKSGAEFRHLENPHPNPSDLTTTLSVAEQITDLETKIKPWIVLDGYHLDSKYQLDLRSAGYRTMVIDDMAHLDRYHANILLNQNIESDQLRYQCDDDTQLFLGVRYALLRSEFLEWQGWQREIPECAGRILVTLGGADPDNVTSKVLDALNYVKVGNLEIIVVVGSTNPHYRELSSIVSSFSRETEKNSTQHSVRLLHHAPNMPELMAWADVAVSGGGSTCWELAFMGLPNLVLVLADNQKGIAEGLDRASVAINLGCFRDVSSAKIAEKLTDLIKGADARRQMSTYGRALVDGYGAKRVAESLSLM